MNTYTTVASTYADQMKDLRRQVLTTALERESWGRSRAARALGLHRTYLLRMVRDMKLEIPPSPDFGGRRVK